MMLAVSGVRRSCEMFDRNCVFSASRDCSSALTCAASFSASSSSVTRCSAVVDESTGCMVLLYLVTSAGCHPLRGDRFVLDRVLELLAPEQRPVASAGHDQVSVASLFDNASFIEHDDPARVAHGADAVRCDDRRPSTERVAQPSKDVRLSV